MFFTPVSRSAMIRFSGMPQRPKPPRHHRHAVEGEPSSADLASGIDLVRHGAPAGVTEATRCGATFRSGNTASENRLRRPLSRRPALSVSPRNWERELGPGTSEGRKSSRTEDDKNQIRLEPPLNGKSAWTGSKFPNRPGFPRVARPAGRRSLNRARRARKSWRGVGLNHAVHVDERLARHVVGVLRRFRHRRAPARSRRRCLPAALSIRHASWS